MNDSFLEDLELGPEQKTGNGINQAEKYITTRHHPQSTPPNLYTEKEELEAIIKEQQKQQKSTSVSAVVLKSSSNKKSPEDSSPSREMYSKRKPIELKDKIHLEVKKSHRENKSPVKVQNKEKRAKVSEDKLKPVENVDRIENLKTSLSSNDGKKRTNSRESTRISDGSSKENSRPSDSSTDTVTHHSGDGMKERSRVSSDTSKKKSDISEDRYESIVMLNAIKEIVSGYTKMESSKIMKMMQDHYINSQANFMKQMMIMTDDLRQPHPTKDPSRIQTLIKENERLVENVAFLKTRVEELQKIVDINEKIRQENAALKMRIRELEK